MNKEEINLEEAVPSKLMLNCLEASKLIVIGELEKLSFKQNVALKFHLIICKLCVAFVKQSTEINRLLSNTFTKSDVTMSEKKKTEIETELNELMK